MKKIRLTALIGMMGFAASAATFVPNPLTTNSAATVSNIVQALANGPTNGIVFSNLSIAMPGVATNTFSFTNVIVATFGEDTNKFVVSGAGTASANGTYVLKSRGVPSAGFIIFTNVNGQAGVIRDPNFDFSDEWAITNAAGTELYWAATEPQNQSWNKTGGLNPVPTASATGYGYSTNYFTNFVVSPFPLPWPVTQNGILYVRTNGNNYSAQRGNPNRAWKSVFQAYTNMTQVGDIMDIGPGLFDETSYPWGISFTYVTPANCTITGWGIGTTKVVGINNGSRFCLGTQNRFQHMTITNIWEQVGNVNVTNVIVEDVENYSDGDGWVNIGVARDCWIVDCIFGGNSDKIADLASGGAVAGGTRLYIKNTTILGGVGADGNGMNVNHGSGIVPIYMGVTTLVTGMTNTIFSEGIVATNFYGGGANLTALNASQLTSGTMPNARLSGNVLTNGNSFSVTFSNNLAVDQTHSFTPRNATASKAAVFASDNTLTNSGLGAVPMNGDSTATTFAQINALAPGNITTNNTGYLTADATSVNTTLGNLSFNNSAQVISGNKYRFTLTLFLDDSVAADGMKIDFNGGSATATNFRVHGQLVNDTGGATALAAAAGTTLAGVINATAMTTVNQHRLIVEGSFEPSSTGTFIPRFAQNAHSTGTLTVRRGSNISFKLCP